LELNHRRFSGTAKQSGFLAGRTGTGFGDDKTVRI
jgi:hypothetical protein